MTSPSNIRPRVLIVEDQALIALALADELDAAGFEVIGPALSVLHAFECLRTADGCDAAVLDVNLGHETAEPIAHELISLSIPFVVMSGYARSQHPPVFRSALSLVKPFGIQALVDELRRLVRQH